VRLPPAERNLKTQIWDCRPMSALVYTSGATPRMVQDTRPKPRDQGSLRFARLFRFGVGVVLTSP
jgi:hypothetical protein